MKIIRTFFLTAAITFAAVLALLYLDRQGAMAYGNNDSISAFLQLFIENMFDLH